ncbi:hypothetical protein HPHPA8_1548 [Helicobacter pylori Hp A-8]|nr:hypothetical protein HPHPA8_1548 [Helicobacter pylori Hp A-8]
MAFFLFFIKYFFGIGLKNTNKIKEIKYIKKLLIKFINSLMR